MARASRAQAESHRREIVDAAAARVRECGVDGLTVPEMMAAAGLTHGGFYRHFSSKSDLVVQACAAAYAEKIRDMEEIRAQSADGPSARETFIERYLSTTHRDHPGRGCGIAATAADAARAPAGSPLRGAYLEGLENMVAKLAEFGADPDADDTAALLEVSLMVGALTLARAGADDEARSARILQVAKDFLLGDQSGAAASPRVSPAS
ncbi:TetR family transcriptional regulator [Nocardia neocaledoniensis]|uniref:TetR family transcriptional regulator n=1 Tax=Nocardia neocaledoniensis TaxID=236511 RepID=UPI002455F3C2|nr:TetR family transcriptional regulator [Nocardia neocaledoniensis]